MTVASTSLGLLSMTKLVRPVVVAPATSQLSGVASAHSVLASPTRSLSETCTDWLPANRVPSAPVAVRLVGSAPPGRESGVWSSEVLMPVELGSAPVCSTGAPTETSEGEPWARSAVAPPSICTKGPGQARVWSEASGVTVTLGTPAACCGRSRNAAEATVATPSASTTTLVASRTLVRATDDLLATVRLLSGLGRGFS
ncbi:hypothetical protein KPL76_06800 [Subtercola sp. PAMC28395]|nr:hypothetical protein KPL76_06800 [Subtercola sp. PAMC28395]